MKGLGQQYVQVWRTTDASLARNVDAGAQVDDLAFDVDGRWFYTVQRGALSWWHIGEDHSLYDSATTIPSDAEDSVRIVMSRSRQVAVLLDGGAHIFRGEPDR